MTDADLLTLADREIQRLTDENDHSAAVLMRELARRLRSPLSTSFSGRSFGDGEHGRAAGFGAVLDRASPGSKEIAS